ncbi:MAG: hypothetical protein F4137_11335 [Acidobacteria bacterium]|nr:hypothetical protein [Acidobacteriota bacterium]
MSNRLADEARTFNENIEEWSKEHGGEFVLLHGTTLIGFFPTYEKDFPPFSQAAFSHCVRSAMVDEDRSETGYG